MAINGRSVSVLINWYKETSFLDLMWEPIKDIADEVVVVAGSYEFVQPSLDFFDQSLSEVEAEAVFRAATGASKVRFLHGPWMAEDDKRVAGYEQCTGDIVLTIDSDEVVDLDLTALTEFVESQYSVSQINVINIATHKFLFGSTSDNYVSSFPKKTFCFKRNQVPAKSHLNYLWLVGVSQDRSSLLPTFPRAIGLMFHATGLRNLDDQFTRTIFYQCLWHRTSPQGDPNKFKKDLTEFTGNKIGYLAKNPTGIGLSLPFYSAFPNASWLENSLWKLILERAEMHLQERWSSALDVSGLPRGNHYFLSFEQVNENLKVGALNHSDLVNQNLLSVKNDGSVDLLAFDPDLLMHLGSTDIVHGFVRLLI